MCMRELVTGQTCLLLAAFLVRRGGIVVRRSHSLLQDGFMPSNQRSACNYPLVVFCQFEERRCEVKVFSAAQTWLHDYEVWIKAEAPGM